jgi:hypothetical protein
MDDVIDAEVISDESTGETHDFESAFVVVLREDGRWVADAGLLDKVVRVARSANVHDFYNAACTIRKDVESRTAAEQTIGLQQQLAAEMAKRAETRKIVDGLDLRNLKI